jgi:hypothetical protein
MQISVESQQELQTIFETRVVPPGHFLELHPWRPLIYGADDPQRKYLDLLLHWLGDDAERDVARFPKGDYSHVSNYFIDWTTQGSVGAGGLQREQIPLWDNPDTDGAQERARRGFARRFNASHSRLGDLTPQALNQDPQRANRLIQGVRKDHSQLNPTTNNLTAEVRASVRQFAVRRACKFLIYDAIGQQRAIAYALDDLDLDAVVNKTAFELESQPGRFKVPVCTSELREMFRRWDACYPWVRFFHDLHAVPPPWDASRGLPTVQAWAAYAVARAGKLAGRLNPQHPAVNALQQVQAQHGQGNYTGAIAAFHAARPSALSPLPNAVWEH